MIRRAGLLWRALLGTKRPPAVIGSRPGFLWENATKRWVPIERATSCRFEAYSEYGPVFTSTGLWP